jgi:hypothetical protein
MFIWNPHFAAMGKSRALSVRPAGAEAARAAHRPRRRAPPIGGAPQAAGATARP